jgi:hypothetical protein
MLRQLARLTRPLPAAGPHALAVAVYADATDRAVFARESGFEGVACVDDAARLLDVMCGVWLRTRTPWAERWASGLAEFVMWMQEPDGRWINFVTAWNGSRNNTGITSRVGDNFWHARALAGLSHAWIAMGNDRVRGALERGIERAAASPAPPDVRAIHVSTALRLATADRGMDLGSTLVSWCDEIASCADARGVLKNSPYERESPHLWGHLQEGVLAHASTVLGERRYGDAAIRSAELLVAPAIQNGFVTARSPYDVASCVYDCDQLHALTNDRRWADLAADARAWFDGRNPAGQPVYDRIRGRVADGVDRQRISENSGAESNIVAAEALFEDVVELSKRLDDPLSSANTHQPDGSV